MQAVKTADTGPELAVRRLLHRLGYRFRLHSHHLPGRPDIVFPGRRKVVFVHGCFWHGHECAKGRLPKSRLDYWAPKIDRNRERDASVLARLAALGWGALVLWQCEVRDTEALAQNLTKFLGTKQSDRLSLANKLRGVEQFH
jgi:DNA mismatch endonuclease (patch repair protein)